MSRTMMNAPRTKTESKTFEKPGGFLLVKKSDKNHVRVEMSEFGGKTMLNIRTWIQIADGWIPTAKGITIEEDAVEKFFKRLGEWKNENL